MTYRQTEQPTLYHAHATRYLREAGGDKRKARRACLADRDDAAGHGRMQHFYAAVLRIIESS